MKALGIAFDDRMEPFTQPPYCNDFSAFSPTNLVPVLIDDDRTVHDTMGITLYLSDRHDGVWPSDPDARAWAQCAAAEMHSGFAALRNDCTMNVGVRVKPKSMSDALLADIDRVRTLFEQGLSRFGGPYLAGTAFSAADAFFAPVAFRVRTYGLDVGAGQAWVDAIIAHPAMRQWEHEALAETWREAGHEAKLAACGAIIADYRQK